MTQAKPQRQFNKLKVNSHEVTIQLLLTIVSSPHSHENFLLTQVHLKTTPLQSPGRFKTAITFHGLVVIIWSPYTWIQGQNPHH